MRSALIETRRLANAFFNASEHRARTTNGPIEMFVVGVPGTFEYVVRPTLPSQTRISISAGEFDARRSCPDHLSSTPRTARQRNAAVVKLQHIHGGTGAGGGGRTICLTVRFLTSRIRQRFQLSCVYYCRHPWSVHLTMIDSVDPTAPTEWRPQDHLCAPVPRLGICALVKGSPHWPS